ncbi:MAG: outer membrane lipoprotein carrier protein LolA [Alphaproteobacteria bacterium]|nr:outer membrane lipoprotein carrier protein LolA [Alphaproteobacteria bacterium]
MKKLILTLILLFAPALAFAAPSAKPATLTPQDKADLTRMENYLNGLKNIAADFIQVDDAGGILHGEIAISRPGKMRVDYEPPDKDFIIADGSFVHIWNDDLKSQTNVEEGSSLAEFILRDPVRMAGDVTVTQFKHMPAKMEVTLVQSSDPAAGSLTLVFEDRPLLLRQWKVIDPQGHTTGVSLQNMSQDVHFIPNYFVFIPPNFSKNSTM